MKSLVRHTLCLLCSALIFIGHTAIGGNLTEVPVNLPGVYAGGVEWGDLDNDSDQDLVLWGETISDGQSLRVVRLYANTGGTLTQAVDLPVGVYHGDVALGDYNNDGKLDLAVSGIDRDDRNLLALFLNQTPAGGALNFVFDDRQPDINTADNAVRYSSLDWGDYNLDGFIDLAVSGLNGQNEASTSIYRNINLDIRHELQRDNAQTLLNMQKGALAWRDYDGDGDPELLINGIGASGFRTARLFKNEPVGTLVEDKTNSGTLTAFSSTAIAWGDYDNDGDADLLQSGRMNGWYTWMTLQENGLGARLGGNVLQDLVQNVLIDAPVSDLAWGDIDNDGDLDIAVMGTTIFSEISGRILVNNGSGQFSAGQTFAGLRDGRLAWGNFDGDGDLDLLLTGVDGQENRVTRLLRNDETAGSPPLPPAALHAPVVTNNSVTFSWEPGSDNETVQTGLTYHFRFGTLQNPNQYFSGASAVKRGNVGNTLSFRLDVQLRPQTYVWSVTTVDKRFQWSQPVSGQFVVQRFVSSEQQLMDLQKSGMAAGDLNNDGLPDLVLAGEDINGLGRSAIYLNDGGVLKPVANSDLIDLSDPAFAFADIDNDGDLDLAVAGMNRVQGRVARIYKNNFIPQGSVNLVEATSLSQQLAAVDQGALDWGDYDNDGDPDLALMGVDRNGNLVTEIYKNTGTTLVKDTDLNLVAYGNGDLQWVDFDNDGDLDLSITGESEEPTQTGRVYINSNGVLTDYVPARFTGLIASSLDWGDYDGDGDMDLIVMGQGLTANFPEIHIYRNILSNNTRALIEQTALTGAMVGLRTGAIRWADYDNDGDPDILSNGSDGSFPYIIAYENTGSGFVEEPQNIWGNDGFQFADMAVVDINGDGDLDILMSGRNLNGVASSIGFDNMEGIDNPNPVPLKPSQMTALVSGANVMLAWDESFDDDVAGAGTPHVTYQIRIGTTAEGGEIISGIAAPVAGGLGFARSTTIYNLASHDYYWSIRSVDNGFRASEWSVPQQFRIDTVKPVVKNVIITPSVTGIGQISVVVEFEENFSMNNTVQPVVQFATADSAVTVVTQSAYSGMNWIGVAFVSESLQSGTAVIRVSGAADDKGNIMLPNTVAGTFRIDTERPSVIETYPETAASGVPNNADIRIVFSENLNLSTVVEDNIKLVREGTEVPARQNGVTWDSTTKTIVFRPVELRPNSQYTVSVVSRIRDLVGNTLDGDYTWTFRTAEQVDASDGGLITNGDGSVQIYFAPDAVSGDLQVPITEVGEPAGLVAGDHPGGDPNVTFTGLAWRIGRADSVVTLEKNAVLTLTFDRTVADELGLDFLKITILRLKDDGSAFDLDQVVGGTITTDAAALGKAAATLQNAVSISAAVGKLGTFGLFEDTRIRTSDEKLADVQFAPRVFSPAGSHPTLPPQTGVSFLLGQSSDVSIDIYNVAGRYVRSLAKSVPMNAGSQSLAWDGRDGDGRVCPMGLYIVRIRAAGAEKVTTVGIVK